MNYFSYVIIIVIFQSLILYECWNEIYLHLFTYLIFEYIKIRTIEQILKALEDVF